MDLHPRPYKRYKHHINYVSQLLINCSTLYTFMLSSRIINWLKIDFYLGVFESHDGEMSDGLFWKYGYNLFVGQPSHRNNSLSSSSYHHHHHYHHQSAWWANPLVLFDLGFEQKYSAKFWGSILVPWLLYITYSNFCIS